MSKFFYVTTPIYYVNDKPHIGHAYSDVTSDILARFKRMDGYNVHFSTGTDEHGQKVEKSALASNKNPQDFVNEVSEFFRELSPLLNISNDIFMRTTYDYHKQAVRDLWKKLEDKGYIYLDKYKGWYALRDEAFYSEDELIKTPEGTLLAPSGAEVEWREEESYFFKLSAFQDKLLDYFEKNPKSIMPRFRYNEIVSFLKSGLKDLAISRTSFSWGIKVPDNDRHVVYVWVDALTNYISAIGYPRMDENFKNYWDNSIHIVGKDITRFHTVYWFAFLMAAEINPPKRVFVHGWWLNDGQKISKSLGNVINPHQLVETYGVDAVRYFFIKEISFGNDGDFSHSSMINRINNELANEYGNLLQRSSSIINKNFLGVLSDISLGDEELEYLNNTNNTLETIRNFIDNQELLKYLEVSWEMIRYANAYINQKAPWKLIKENNTKEAANCLYFICEILRRVSLLLTPIIPESANKILDQLNIPLEERSFLHFNNYISKKNYTINPPSIIFQKIMSE